MDAIVYHGSAEDREMLRKLEFRYTTTRGGGKGKGGGKGRGGSGSEDAYKMHVVITTPETCMAADSKTATGRMRRELSSIQVIDLIETDPSLTHLLSTTSLISYHTLSVSTIQWDFLVVDEAHKLKNYDSKFTATLRDEYIYQNCLLLTGTPLQVQYNLIRGTIHHHTTQRNRSPIPSHLI